jgi:hypothetical protein
MKCWYIDVSVAVFGSKNVLIEQTFFSQDDYINVKHFEGFIFTNVMEVVLCL